MWVRLGGFYNNSRYTRFVGGGTSPNKVLYAAADRQLTQPDGLKPGRGLYVGASAFWAPQDVNVYTRSYEGRVYATGLFDSRPSDTISLKVTYNKFGRPAIEQSRRLGQFASDDQWTINLNYSLHAHRGVYVIPSLSYLDHPSFVGDFRHSVLASGTLFLIF